jgi:hypothetical protein
VTGIIMGGGRGYIINIIMLYYNVMGGTGGGEEL